METINLKHARRDTQTSGTHALPPKAHNAASQSIPPPSAACVPLTCSITAAASCGGSLTLSNSKTTSPAVHVESSPLRLAEECHNCRQTRWSDVAASGQRPARQADRSELQSVVREAISSLSDNQRMAVLLAKFEHCSYEEIATAMGLSVPAVKSLLFRARDQLRTVLEPYEREGLREPAAGSGDACGGGAG